MKKLRYLCITVVCLCIPGGTWAQDSYLHVGAGYNFRNASGVLDGFYNNTLTTQSYTESQVMMSMGSGAAFDLGMATYSDGGAGFSLRFSYLLGAAATATEVSSISIVDKEVVHKLSGRYFRIVPAFTIRSEPDNLTPYMQLGMVFGLGNATLSKTENLGQTMNFTTWMYEGGFTVGAMAAGGLMIETSQLTHIFIEASIYSVSWAPGKKVMTEAIVDEDDVLQDLPLSIREVHYESENTIDYNNPPGANEPDVQLRFSIPMSSIGIHAGLRLLL